MHGIVTRLDIFDILNIKMMLVEPALYHDRV